MFERHVADATNSIVLEVNNHIVLPTCTCTLQYTVHYLSLSAIHYMYVLTLHFIPKRLLHSSNVLGMKFYYRLCTNNSIVYSDLTNDV